MNEPYPLAALRKLRDAAESDRTRDLAMCAAAEHAALAVLAAGEKALGAHREETERARAEERARFSTARMASEHVRVGDWLAHRRREEAALTEAAVRAQQALDAAVAATGAARTALALAKAEVEALERHRAAWEAERRATREQRAEEESDDLVRARAHLRRG